MTGFQSTCDQNDHWNLLDVIGRLITRPEFSKTPVNEKDANTKHWFDFDAQSLACVRFNIFTIKGKLSLLAQTLSKKLAIQNGS